MGISSWVGKKMASWLHKSANPGMSLVEWDRVPLSGNPFFGGGTSTKFDDVELWGRPSDAELEYVATHHPIIYHGIQILATSFLEAPARMGQQVKDGWEDGTEVQEEWIQRLVLRPNLSMTQLQFMQCVFQNRIATGRCFIWLWRNKLGEVTEMWPIPTSTVQVVKPSNMLTAGEDVREVLYYEVNISNLGITKRVDIADMIDYRIPDANDLSDVVSPLSTVWRAVRLDAMVENYIAETFNNSRLPGVVVHQSDRFTPQQEEDIRKTFEMRFGLGGRGRPLFLSGKDVGVQTMSGLGSQGQPDITAYDEFRIAMALNVPAAILGTWASARYSTYSNMEMWEKIFAQYTRVPNWLSFGEALNKAMPSDWQEDGLEVYFDTSNVVALQGDAKVSAERASLLFSGGLATRNESRQMAGLSEDPKRGEYYAMPMSLMEVSAKEKPDDLTLPNELQDTEDHVVATEDTIP